MRIRYLALVVALIIVVNAAITYGIVQRASPSGAQGPRGEQGIPGPVATADANTTLCAAAMSGMQTDTSSRQFWADQMGKYCP